MKITSGLQQPSSLVESTTFFWGEEIAASKFLPMETEKSLSRSASLVPFEPHYF